MCAACPRLQRNLSSGHWELKRTVYCTACMYVQLLRLQLMLSKGYFINSTCIIQLNLRIKDTLGQFFVFCKEVVLFKLRD